MLMRVFTVFAVQEVGLVKFTIKHCTTERGVPMSWVCSCYYTGKASFLYYLPACSDLTFADSLAIY